jgi:gliding motility-associated-like protein
VDDADSTLTISFPDTSTLNGIINYADGNITYTPDENYFGHDTLVYAISDPSGAADTSMVVFQVQSGNEVPVVLGNTFTSTEDEQNTIDLLELIQDDDPDSLLLVEQVNEDLTRGEIAIDDGMITYTPQPDFFGNDTIFYQVSDTDGNQVDSFLIVEIEPVNDSPEAGTIYVELVEDDESKMIDLLQNASDIDNDTTDLTVSGIIYTSGKGTVSRFGDSINYIPGDGIAGTDTIMYVIEDPEGLVDTSIVVITLAPGLEKFAAVNDTLEIHEDAEKFLIDVLANDQFGLLANVELILLSEKSTNLGSISVVHKKISYNPFPDLNGDELLTYQIKNNDGDSATAKIVLKILPVNDAPEASDDYFVEVDASSEILLDVLANDNDIDNDKEDLTITNIELTTLKGNVEVINGQIRYTPSSDYHQVDSFMYFINDGELQSSAMVYIHFAEEEIQDPELLISQGLSPNGDGINDKWIISGIEYYPVNKVMIFNRWGDQVASYEGYDNQVTVWKGESQRVFNWETELPDGTYFYVIEIGVGTVFKGSVELRK